MQGVIITLAGLLLTLPAMAQGFTTVPPDRPVSMGDVEAVCTGASLNARENPAWASYPLRVEIAGKGGQYLGDVHLSLSQNDKTLAEVACDGPWILFRLAAGRYRLEAQTEGKTTSSNAYVPASGQGRIILRFPDLGGEIGATPQAGN
jgi:hypothetical protein